MNPLDAALAAIPAELDPFDAAKARAMVVAYCTFWDATEAEVLAVEREFLAPFVRPDGTVDPDWLLAGKIDLALRIDGRVVLVDHKTSSEDVSPGGTFRARLALNAQATHYIIGARSIELEAEAFMFDVLGKPGIEPALATPVESRKYTAEKWTKHPDCKGKGCSGCTDGKTLAEPARLYANQRDRDETPAEYFARCCVVIAENPDRYLAQIEVMRTEREVERYMRELLIDSTLMDTVREYGLVSMNEGACFQYGGRPCSYHPVCSGTATVDDRRLYEIKRAHEELDVRPPPGRRLLTVSRRSSFNSCRQRHDYRYERGIAPVQRDATLSFGTAVHAAAERYWMARAWGAALAA